MSNIEKVVKQAISTFSIPQCFNKFQENLSNLMQNTNNLTLNDVYFDKKFLKIQNRYSGNPNPILYIRIFEDVNILVSVFVLKSNSVIPTHNHPLMHGILKVLSGSVRIQSYSVRGNSIKKHDINKFCLPSEYYFAEADLYTNPIKVKKNTPLILSESDSCTLLTPIENNIHEVQSYNGPSVFMDILAPAYDTYVRGIGPRKCLYFNEENCSNTDCILSLQWEPPNYWTMEIPFQGPKIQIENP